MARMLRRPRRLGSPGRLHPALMRTRSGQFPGAPLAMPSSFIAPATVFRSSFRALTSALGSTPASVSTFSSEQVELKFKMIREPSVVESEYGDAFGRRRERR